MAEPSPSNPRVNDPRFAPLGGHQYAIADGEGPDGGDVLHLRGQGRIELDDAELILALLDRIAAQHGRVFFISHMSSASGISPEARRYYNDHLKQQKTVTRWTFVIGASLLVQTLMALMVRGTHLITGRERLIYTVQSPAEALALITKLRARPSASGKPGS